MCHLCHFTVTRDCFDQQMFPTLVKHISVHNSQTYICQFSIAGCVLNSQRGENIENAGIDTDEQQPMTYRCRGKFVAPGKFFPPPYCHNVTNANANPSPNLNPSPNPNPNFNPTLNPNPYCCVWE